MTQGYIRAGAVVLLSVWIAVPRTGKKELLPVHVDDDLPSERAIPDTVQGPPWPELEKVTFDLAPLLFRWRSLEISQQCLRALRAHLVEQRRVPARNTTAQRLSRTVGAAAAPLATSVATRCAASAPIHSNFVCVRLQSASSPMGSR